MLDTLANRICFKCSPPVHEAKKDTGADSTVFLKPKLKPNTLLSTTSYFETVSPCWGEGRIREVFVPYLVGQRKSGRTDKNVCVFASQYVA